MIPALKIRFNGGGVRLAKPAFTREDNASLLESGIASIKERLARGIDAEDKPTKPLTGRYARLKQRKYGRPPVRDMRLTGRTLDSLRVRSSDSGEAVAEAQVFNADQARLMQFSPRDQIALDLKAGQIFDQKVSRFSIRDHRTDFSRQTSFSRS